MFQPPKEVATTVYAQLPDNLRLRGRRSGWTVGRHQQDLDAFLEGPSFDRDGNLYVVDIPFGRIFKISPGGGDWSVVAEYDGWPNGLRIHKDGRLFVADHRRGIMCVDPASGRVEPVLEGFRREGFKGTNDLVFSSSGDLYFTDQGQTGLQDPTGRVYCLRANGQVDCLLKDIPSPNGLVLSPDERTLFVAVTRANQVWQLPLQPDGQTSKVGVFLQLSGGAGPDGIAMDAQGGLAVAHVGLGTVWIFNKLGEPTHRVRSSDGLLTTNVAYGGADGKSLFVTESASSKILRAELPVAGQAMYSHR